MKFNILSKTEIVFILLLQIIFYLLYRVNVLLFHAAAESLAIMVSFMVFAFSVTIKKFQRENFYFFVGIVYLLVGLADLLHMLGYKGMGVFYPEDVNLSVSLWLLGRATEAIGIFCAPWVLYSRKKAYIMLALLIVVYVSALIAIFTNMHDFHDIFFVDGVGLTPLKIGIEVVICIVLLLSTIPLWKQRMAFSEKSLTYLFGAIAITVVAEVCFMLYDDIHGFSNMLGHLFKIVSFYQLYKSVVHVGLTEPFSSIFKTINLEMSNDKGRILDLQDDIKKTLTELDNYERAIDNVYLLSITDLSGKILSVNNKFCQVSGYSRSELIGSNHRIVNSGFHPKDFFENMWTTIKSGKTWVGMIHNRAKSGRDYWVFGSISPFYNADGIIDKFVAIRIDMTAEKRNEQILLKNQRMSVIGEVTSQVLHDTMNPLTIIILNAKKIKMQLTKINTSNIDEMNSINKSLEKVEESCSRIESFFQRIRSELNEKGDWKEFNGDRAIISLRELVEKAHSYTSHKMELLGVEFVNEIPDEISLFCYPNQLVQVFVNLFGNSCDAIANLSIKRWVKVSCKKTEHTTYISVADAGPGIPPEIRDLIFQKLFTTKAEHGGTGLGMGICQKIIEAHGGTIQLNDQSTNTEFVIEIPNRG